MESHSFLQFFQKILQQSFTDLGLKADTDPTICVYKKMLHIWVLGFWFVLGFLGGFVCLFVFILHQKCTVTIQFCDILGQDNHSLSVPIPPQIGFPEVEDYQTTKNKDTYHSPIPYKLHSEGKDSSDCPCILFLFYLLQKSLS